MGNEIMTQNVQNYTGFNPAMYGMCGMNMGMPMGNLFNGQMGMNSYANDIMAPDFVKNPYYYMNNQNSLTQNTQNTQSQSVFANPQYQTQQIPAQTFTGNNQPEESVLPQSEDDNTIQKTNAGKTVGILAGISVPLLSAASKVLSGAKFSDVFKFKELGLKAGAFALAGWCAGALLDGFINSAKQPQTVKQA